MSGQLLRAIVCVATVLPLICSALDCEGGPTTGLVYQLMKRLIAVENIKISEVLYTCLVQGDKEGTYQQASMLVQLEISSRNRYCQLHLKMDCVETDAGSLWDSTGDDDGLMAIPPCGLTNCGTCSDTDCPVEQMQQCQIADTNRYILFNTTANKAGSKANSTATKYCSSCTVDYTNYCQRTSVRKQISNWLILYKWMFPFSLFFGIFSLWWFVLYWCWSGEVHRTNYWRLLYGLWWGRVLY